MDGSEIESRGATLTGRMTVLFKVLFAFTAPDDDDDELFTAVMTTAYKLTSLTATGVHTIKP